MPVDLEDRISQLETLVRAIAMPTGASPDARIDALHDEVSALKKKLSAIRVPDLAEVTSASRQAIGEGFSVLADAISESEERQGEHLRKALDQRIDGALADTFTAVKRMEALASSDIDAAVQYLRQASYYFSHGE